MADLEANILTKLLATGAVTAIFGTSLTRIYVDRINPSITTEYPFAILQTVFEAPDYAHDGELKDRSMIQIDVRSKSKTTVNSGIAAIRAVLSGLTGTVGTTTFGSSFVSDTRGSYDQDGRVFMRSIDFIIAQNG